MALGVGLVALAAGATALVLSSERPANRVQVARPDAPQPQAAPAPTLHCLFSDFTHASVVAGFDFAVTLPGNGPPRFAERGEALRNDPAINFDAGARPAWTYAIDEDGIATISSPDGATRILLFGLKLDSDETMWIEAGIRSNTIRNLDGKCLQSHFAQARLEASGPAR